MAIPTSPSVVVLENDVSIYTPNINSSVVGLVGFANKGPTNKATLVTSQENLIRTFGKPDTLLNGQGLEGALEILLRDPSSLLVPPPLVLLLQSSQTLSTQLS